MLPRRVVVLCDNETEQPEALGHEWGLALAVDVPGHGLWLWDTGQTDLFLKNAAMLDLDAGAARGLALSHGHYDHTGGLAALMAAGFAGVVHAHPACALPRFAEEKGGRPRRSIGPPLPLPDFTPAGPLTVLAPGLILLTDIPRAPGAFQAVQGFSLDAHGAQPDPVPDDAFLVLETGQGPVAILGCCHSGLGNSLACARERLGHRRFFAVLGGLHLFQADTQAVQETARALEEFGVRQLVAGHCTGRDRVDALGGLLPACDVRLMAAGQCWTY